MGDLEEPLLELHAACEIGPFWKAARRLLENALPIHFACLYLRPSSLTPSAIFRDGAPFRTNAEFQRFHEINPIPSFFDAHLQAVAVRLSDIVPEAELMRSEFYQTFLARGDDRYLACLNFRQQQTLLAMICLHRTRLHRDFSEIEMQLLELIYPHLKTALKRVLAWHREHTERFLLGALVSHLPLATVLLDWDLSVLFCNGAARELAVVWNLGSERARSLKIREHFSLPGEIQAECQTLKSNWIPSQSRRQVSSPNHTSVIHHPNMPELRLIVSLLDLAPSRLSMPAFMLRFEDRRNFAELDLSAAPSPLCQLGRLSHREQEVAQLVCSGHTNKEIATMLGKSVLTVKKQLQFVYEKLRVSSRTKLINLLRD